MIEYPGRIFFSRWEKPTEESGWFYKIAYQLCTEARSLFMDTDEFENNDWKEWNVLELHGWHLNPQLHIVWYKGLGVHPYPEEIRRVVYHRKAAQLEELEISDPFLLHHSHKLIPDEPFKGDPLTNPRDRARWKERVEEFYEQVQKHAIIYHPGAHQKSTWDKLQKMKKIEILNLPDDDYPTRIDNWEIVEINPEFGYADFSKL
jgi:hypothetical protein